MSLPEDLLKAITVKLASDTFAQALSNPAREPRNPPESRSRNEQLSFDAGKLVAELEQAVANFESKIETFENSRTASEAEPPSALAQALLRLFYAVDCLSARDAVLSKQIAVLNHKIDMARKGD